LINEGDGFFRVDSLPTEAQLAPVRSASFSDVNADGFMDIILAGNRLNVRPDVGRMDAGQGMVLLQTPSGKWKAASFLQSGLYVPDEITDMKWLTLGTEQYLLFAGIHQPVVSYRLHTETLK
jgi:hypothetical protein